MKNMVKISFPVVIEQDEDGVYIGTVPTLPGCHTQGKNLDELMERMKEAIELYIEENGKDLTAIQRTRFMGLQHVEVEL